jgi:hypothetical protein
MQKTITGLMAVGLVAFAAAPLRAGDGCCGGCGGCGYQIVWEKQTITVNEAHCEWRDETRQVCRVVYDVVETPHTCTVLVPTWAPVTRTVTCYHTEMQTQERDITVCCRVPVCCVDPCTGCCYTSWQCVQQTRHVTCCVPVCVPETKDITVQVCTMVAQDRTYTTRCCVPRTVTDTVPVKVAYTVCTPVQRDVWVARCVPCAPAACAPTTCCYSSCGGCGDCGGCYDSCCGHHRRGGRW